MACALVFFCSLQAFLEEAGHNGETEAPIQPNHLFRILCAEESLKFVCCKPSCLSMGSSQPLVWFAVWLQYISALQAPTEAAGDNRKTEAPLHFFAWFETSLSGEIEVPDGWAPDCVELATWCGLCFGHLWFQSAFCRLYLKQLDTMGRQRPPWVIFSILRLIHFACCKSFCPSMGSWAV